MYKHNDVITVTFFFHDVLLCDTTETEFYLFDDMQVRRKNLIVVERWYYLKAVSWPSMLT